MVEPPAVKKRASTRDRRRYSDRRIYLIQAVRKRRRKLRAMALQLKGGRCEKCGYDRCQDALEFHHPSGSSKDFGITSKGLTRSWQVIRREIGKCQLLCANCHREVHSKLQLPRETGVEKSGEFRET